MLSSSFFRRVKTIELPLMANRLARFAYKNPYQVLGISRNNLTAESLNKRYIELIKTYHPDVSSLPNSTEKYKEIKEAYDQLKVQFAHESASRASESSKKQGPKEDYSQEDKETTKKRMNLKTEEDYLYYIIFGKSYEEDPEAFFLTENLEKKREFLKKVAELRGENLKPGYRPSSGQRVFETRTQPDSSTNTALLCLLAGGLTAFGLYFFNSHRTHQQFIEKEKQSYISEEKISEMRDKGWEREYNIIDTKVEKVLSELPRRMLKYPVIAPGSCDILLHYTIWKDIEVFSTFMNQLVVPEFKDKIVKGEMQVPRSPVDCHQPNTLASIALEAERVLKKTYVNM